MIDTSLEGFEGGASSWNDLTDKPFYDNGQEVEIPVWNLDSAYFDREENPDNPDEVIYFYGVPFDPEPETEYTVTINGQTSVATTQEFYGIFVLGNLHFLDSYFPDTGEPFLIFDGDIITSVPGETHSINVSKTITAIEKEIKPEANVTFTYAENMGPLPINIEDFDFSSIQAGDMLKVSVDGAEYVSTVQEIEGMPVFGNLVYMMDAEWTGEPYVGMYQFGMSGLYLAPQKVPVTLTIEKYFSEGNQSIISNKVVELKFDDGIYYATFKDDGELEDDCDYDVIFNDTRYEAISSTNGEYIGIGCQDDNNDFYISYNTNLKVWEVYLYYTSNIPETFNATVSIVGYVSGVKKLDNKYIDFPEVPVASWSKEGIVKVYDVWSGLSGRSNFLPIYLDSNNNMIYASMPTNIPRVQKSMTDLNPGVSSLATNTIYLVYE